VNKKVSFHELAEFELNDATVFLEIEREGLGLRFLSAVEAAVAQIREHPEASPVIIQDVRRKVLRRFPYSIMYSIKPDRIRILAIANQRRRPFYWRGRT
jgi:plasmid stabilization system protein ParE